MPAACAIITIRPSPPAQPALTTLPSAAATIGVAAAAARSSPAWNRS
jgi:hypothetical protein